MWERVDPHEMPYELPRATSSVWRHQPTNSFAGAMMFHLLSPPFLWFKLGIYDFAAKRLARASTDELQLLLNAPQVRAEPEPDNDKAERFLRFVGFEPRMSAGGLPYYERDL